MVYAKCLRIDTSKHTFLLKDGNNKEMWVSSKQLQSAIDAKKINIINLDPNLKITKGAHLYSYKYLGSDEMWEGSVNTYNKSTLLNAAPTIKFDGISADNYGQLIITDYTRKFRENIEANEVTFMGEQSLIKDGGIIKPFVKVKCDKAIVRNKCVMASFVQNGAVMIDATVVELKHNFIDANTVYEVFQIFESNKDKKLRDRTSAVYVYFDLENTDLKKICRNVKSIYKEMYVTRTSLIQALNIELNSIKKQIGSYPQSMDDPYNKKVLKYLEQWCALLLFMNSMCKSMEKSLCGFHEEINKVKELIYPLHKSKVLDFMYALVRQFKWEFPNHSEPYVRACKLVDYTVEQFEKHSTLEI